MLRSNFDFDFDHIPEMLALTLLFLDNKQINEARLVCKYWHQIITNNYLIQAKLQQHFHQTLEFLPRTLQATPMQNFQVTQEAMENAIVNLSFFRKLCSIRDTEKEAKEFIIPYFKKDVVNERRLDRLYYIAYCSRKGNELTIHSCTSAVDEDLSKELGMSPQTFTFSPPFSCDIRDISVSFRNIDNPDTDKCWTIYGAQQERKKSFPNMKAWRQGNKEDNSIPSTSIQPKVIAEHKKIEGNNLSKNDVKVSNNHASTFAASATSAKKENRNGSPSNRAPMRPTNGSGSCSIS